MLSDELALAYDQQGLRYLIGLRCLRKEHRALVVGPTAEQFLALPLGEASSPGDWGHSCTVGCVEWLAERGLTPDTAGAIGRGGETIAPDTG